MPSLTIKGLPARVHKGLKDEAKRQGRSLNGYVLSCLEERAEEAQRRKRMRQSWPEYEKFVKTLPRLGDSTPLLREDRNR